MKIHHRQQGGIVVTEHPNPMALVSRFSGAAGVLYPDALVLLTIPMSGHSEAAMWAGREFTDGLKPEDGTKLDLSHRLQLAKDGVTCELWTEKDDVCPYQPEVLATLESYVREHAKMRWLKRHPEIDFSIAIWTDEGITWTYSRGELQDVSEQECFRPYASP